MNTSAHYYVTHLYRTLIPTVSDMFSVNKPLGSYFESKFYQIYNTSSLLAAFHAANCIFCVNIVNCLKM